MKGIINIEGSPNLVRDLHSHAVINKDTNALKAYHAAKDKKLKDAERINKLESEVKEIKSSVNEILQILKGSK